MSLFCGQFIDDDGARAHSITPTTTLKATEAPLVLPTSDLFLMKEKLGDVWSRRTNPGVQAHIKKSPGKWKDAPCDMGTNFSTQTLATASAWGSNLHASFMGEKRLKEHSIGFKMSQGLDESTPETGHCGLCGLLYGL